MLKMLRLTSITLLCLAVTLGWASPIGKDLAERDPEYNPDLFEGDILGVLPGQKPRNAIRDPDLLWPGGVVYYTVGNGYTANELATLQEAFDLYEANTCLTFVQRTNQRNYVAVQKTGGGCYSYVGMIGGAQTLSLDSSCFRCSVSGCLPGTPIHEFLHAVGFHHEQSRTDRDDYVTINYDNIQPGREGNFESYSQDEIQHLAGYDYGSVMHYGAYAFAVDPTIPTIITLNGEEIGQRVGFSEIDLIEVNALYGCQKK